MRYRASTAFLHSRWVGSISLMYACLRTCTAVYAQRVEGVSVMWMLRQSERRGWDIKNEGQITGFGQNKDTLMTLGGDKSKLQGNSSPDRVPVFLQMLFMQNPHSKIKRQGYWRALLYFHASELMRILSLCCTLTFPTSPQQWHGPQ